MALPAGLQGFAVQFSPYGGGELAVACAQHFGVAGSGALVLLRPQTASSSAAPSAAPVVMYVSFRDGLGKKGTAWREDMREEKKKKETGREQENITETQRENVGRQWGRWEEKSKGGRSGRSCDKERRECVVV